MCGTSEARATGAEYQPGICNIGPEKIARRRLAGHIALPATIVLFVVLVAIAAPGLRNVVGNLVLGVFAVAIAYGEFVVAPF
jgi:hypothetical protein